MHGHSGVTRDIGLLTQRQQCFKLLLHAYAQFFTSHRRKWRHGPKGAWEDRYGCTEGPILVYVRADEFMWAGCYGFGLMISISSLLFLVTHFSTHVRTWMLTELFVFGLFVRLSGCCCGHYCYYYYYHKKSIRGSNSFDPVQDRSYVGSDLGRSKLFAKLAGMSIYIHR